MKKTALFIGLAALFVALLVAFGDRLSLEAIQDSLQSIRDYNADNRALFSLGFVGLYVLVTALSLPFAIPLTLLGGAIFGFWQGLALVSIASTIGATLSFLASRYLFRDWVQGRYERRLSAINRGFEKDGAYYLFALRMVPIFPFFLINLLMGLTPIKTRTFTAVSWLGMLPGTAVFVYAGRNLGQLESLSGILSPAMIFSFVLLGTAPLLARWLLNAITARRVYKPFDRPRSFDRNLVVIGAGSAGLVASYMAASSKASVTLVESNLMGGDCLNFGCIPSKALIKSATVAQTMRDAERYGLDAHDPQFSIKTIGARIQDVVATIAPHDSVERYRDMGVDVVLGHARIVDPWRVEITAHPGDRYTLTTNSIVVATGAEPFVPPIKGLANIAYLTSDTLWASLAERDELPERFLVLGGGPIGCELAQALARLGATVTLVEMADRLLLREDDEVSELAQKALEQSGVEVLTGHRAIEFSANTVTLETGTLDTVTLDDGGTLDTVTLDDGGTVDRGFDAVLVAVGRKARVEGFGLEELGVDVDRTVVADRYLRTNFPNIYVAGDAAGPFQFTHAAGYQGTYAGLNALFGGLYRFKMDYRVMPACTFTDPEIARVGLNEREARADGVDYDVTHYPISRLDRAITATATDGFIKILTVAGKDKILGVTIVSEHAGEMLGEFALAMKHNLGLRKILGTVHAYPTWGEGAKNAAGVWSKAHLNQRAVAISQWYLTRRRR